MDSEAAKGDRTVAESVSFTHRLLTTHVTALTTKENVVFIGQSCACAMICVPFDMYPFLLSLVATYCKNDLAILVSFIRVYLSTFFYSYKTYLLITLKLRLAITLKPHVFYPLLNYLLKLEKINVIQSV